MTTQTRLDAYLAAETKILSAQEVRGGDVNYRRAELEEVRKAIKSLQTQLARETARSNGQKMRKSVASFNNTSH